MSVLIWYSIGAKKLFDEVIAHEMLIYGYVLYLVIQACYMSNLCMVCIIVNG